MHACVCVCVCAFMCFRCNVMLCYAVLRSGYGIFRGAMQCYMRLHCSFYLHVGLHRRTCLSTYAQMYICTQDYLRCFNLICLLAPFCLFPYLPIPTSRIVLLRLSMYVNCHIKVCRSRCPPLHAWRAHTENALVHTRRQEGGRGVKEAAMCVCVCACMHVCVCKIRKYVCV